MRHILIAQGDTRMQPSYAQQLGNRLEDPDNSIIL